MSVSVETRLKLLESILTLAACMAIAEEMQPWKELGYRWLLERYGMNKAEAEHMALKEWVKLK